MAFEGSREKIGIFAELWAFMRVRKKWWLGLIVLMLALLGLPAGADMPGRVLEEAFAPGAAVTPARIASWEQIGRRRVTQAPPVDPGGDSERLERLRALVKPQTLPEQIAELEARLQDARARIPKHTPPAALMVEIDELEEALEELHSQLDASQ